MNDDSRTKTIFYDNCQKYKKNLLTFSLPTKMLENKYTHYLN